MENYVHKEDWKSAICENTDGPWRHYAKRNKSDIKKYVYLTTWIQNIKTEAKFTDDRLLVARGCGERWKVDKWVRKVNRYRLYF